MSDPLIRALDHYVVLEAGGPERILSAAETLAWLTRYLEALADLPADLKAIEGANAQAERLLDTACELDLAPGMTIQWFAVRLEPAEGDQPRTTEKNA
jgi:hypothetical protein